MRQRRDCDCDKGSLLVETRVRPVVEEQRVVKDRVALRGQLIELALSERRWQRIDCSIVLRGTGGSQNGNIWESDLSSRLRSDPTSIHSQVGQEGGGAAEG